jgi:hypothetical protein
MVLTDQDDTSVRMLLVATGLPFAALCKLAAMGAPFVLSGAQVQVLFDSFVM